MKCNHVPGLKTFHVQGLPKVAWVECGRCSHRTQQCSYDNPLEAERCLWQRWAEMMVRESDVERERARVDPAAPSNLNDMARWWSQFAEGIGLQYTEDGDDKLPAGGIEAIVKTYKEGREFRRVANAYFWPGVLDVEVRDIMVATSRLGHLFAAIVRAAEDRRQKSAPASGDTPAPECR